MPALRTRDTQSRPLDVATDAPQPPTLNIVSPTPRAFTFPTSHNLSASDSPYSSPSTSPFEPDLRSNQPAPSASASSSTPPQPPVRTLSPEIAPAPLRSSSPVPSTHKRRKSSCSSDVDRRPKKGDEDYIKRPENAFILFRRKCCEDRQQAQEEAASADAPTKKQRQADLSKTISQQWKSLSAEERQYWEQLAKDKKKEHEQLYPNYVYRPQRAKDKDGRAKNKKSSKKLDSDIPESLSFIVPTVPRPHGRSASAPTPPPYQSIQVPNVYQLTPSCPTSPSLLPMISRRSAHPGHSDDPLASFDYMPTNTFSSFPTPGQFESSFQSSEFLRSMFTPMSTQRNNSTTQLQQLNMASSESLLLPSQPSSMVSPATSSGSSSGPPSPRSGPYTPISALSVPQTYAILSADSNGTLGAQQQQALDLQLEMQMQHEFAAFSWGGNNGSLWSMDQPSELLSSDFDLNAIPPIELGGKFAESVTSPVSLASEESSAFEFGREFTHTIESRPFNHGGMLGFDEMMAGHGF